MNKSRVIALFTVLVVFLGIILSCEKSDESLASVRTGSSVSTWRAVVGNSDIPGWSLVINEGDSYGYKLYEKDGDYLQKINLKMGSSLVIATIRPQPNGKIPSSPLFPRASMEVFWNSRPQKALSVTNCQFFIPAVNDDIDTGTKAGPLSYPVKYEGAVRSTGSANDDGIPKRKFGINTASKEAWIAPYQNSSNKASAVIRNLQSPTVIVGTDPYQDNTRYGRISMGRTMIGIYDQDRDGKNEVIYVFTGSCSQTAAIKVLTSLGCSKDNVLMLDGHYSSQMMAEGVDYYSSFYGLKNRRNIPCVFYVVHK